MKKMTSRILALFLVMILMVSAVPVVLADDAYTLTLSCSNVEVGKDTAATVVLQKNNEDQALDGVSVVLDHSGTNTGEVSISGTTIKGIKAGSVTLKATYTTPEGTVINSSPVAIEVGRRTISAPQAPTVPTLAVGQYYDVDLFKNVEWMEGETAPAVVLTVKDNNPAVTVAGNRITAAAMGSATVIATWADFAETEYSNALSSGSVEIPVNVNSTTINCVTKDIALGSTGYTLEPSLATELPAGASVEFAFKQVSGLGGSVSSDGKINPTSVGEIGIEITAAITGSVQNTLTSTVYVGIYDSSDVEASVSKSVAYVDEKGAFDSLKKDGEYKDASKNSLISLLEVADVRSFSLTAKKTAAGTFSSKTWLSATISAEKFNRTGTGITEYSYEAYSTNNRLVGRGKITITSGTSDGDIVYDTSPTKKVTFDEKDFVEFWSDNKLSTFRSTELSYVKFDLQSSLTGNNRLPQAGDLYRRPECTSLYKVLNSDKFAPYYTSNMSDMYDLDTVTYLPDESEKYLTSVTIPFTAYGNKDNESISGTIVINLNASSAIDITSRGVLLGNSNDKIIETMGEYYKAATDTTLSYVKFSIPAASKGKLFYNFSSVLDSSLVSSSYEYYVDATGTKLDLEKVAFVPRAGLYGEVSITYTGYDANGQNEYNGTLTFNVTEKTKSAKFSDVNASSYSWAADAVDFLYYEGVANGSNGKYNPASNITRGDFMLMLYRAFLEDEYEDYNVTSNFPDVVKGSDSYSKETYQAVGVAKYLGIAQGTNGKYNPKAYITREEAMTLIYRTLDEVGYSMSYTVSTDTDDFKDYSSVASYAKTAISDLIEHGVVVGTNGKINPKSNITRAEMAVILHRVLTY